MAKKTDPKSPAKPIKKKAGKLASAAKSTVAAKPAKPTAAEPAAAKVKAASSTAAKPVAKKMSAAKPVAKQPAAKKSSAKTKPAAVESAPQAVPDLAEPVAEYFYFLSETIDPQITTTRPAHSASNGQVSAFTEFAEVRQHAIDYLVDLIDRCEVRLWQVKRADSPETLRHLVREHDHPPVPAAGEEAPLPRLDTGRFLYPVQCNLTAEEQRKHDS